MSETKVHNIVEIVEQDGAVVIQQTEYELRELEEREDDGKRITSYIGICETGRLALVDVVRKSDEFEMWATASVEKVSELFHHPSRFVSPGEASLMWPSKLPVEVDSFDQAA